MHKPQNPQIRYHTTSTKLPDIIIKMTINQKGMTYYLLSIFNTPYTATADQLNPLVTKCELALQHLEISFKVSILFSNSSHQCLQRLTRINTLQITMTYIVLYVSTQVNWKLHPTLLMLTTYCCIFGIQSIFQLNASLHPSNWTVATMF